MLSVFPDILFLAPFSAFLIRIALALVFIFAGWKHFSREKNPARALAAFEIIAAISLASGAWTQVGALLGIIIASLWLTFPHTRAVSKIATLLALVMCVSLLVTGGGVFAFDLPL
ncbi:MAG: hypothetical protein AAB830_03005 [Patescibacteria group bacterium]